MSWLLWTFKLLRNIILYLFNSYNTKADEDYGSFKRKVISSWVLIYYILIYLNNTDYIQYRIYCSMILWQDHNFSLENIKRIVTTPGVYLLFVPRLFFCCCNSSKPGPFHMVSNSAVFSKGTRCLTVVIIPVTKIILYILTRLCFVKILEIIPRMLICWLLNLIHPYIRIYTLVQFNWDSPILLNPHSHD